LFLLANSGNGYIVYAVSYCKNGNNIVDFHNRLYATGSYVNLTMRIRQFVSAPPIRQFLIVLSYTFVCALVLTNRSGGADIAFVFLFVVCATVHLFVGVMKAIKGKWSALDIFLLTCYAILVLFMFYTFSTQIFRCLRLLLDD
jgi:hypothetical protein